MTLIFESPRELLGTEGRKLGPTAWLTIDQARIDGFAECTGDHQWIHIDAVRAKDGPYGGTIAHGYLTLSLTNLFLPEMIEVRNFAAGINVGADNVRFLSPVLVGSRIRGHGEIVKVEERKAGAIQSIVRITIEIEGNAKPACVVDSISRYFPL